MTQATVTTTCPFVHLNVRSSYSLLEGLPTPKAIAKKARELGMPAVGVVDKNNLFGAVDVSKNIGGAGIQPIIGCTLGIRREDKQPNGFSYEPDSITLLVQNEEGWQNLIWLNSQSWITPEDHESAQIGLDVILTRTAGLLALTGNAREGRLARLLREGKLDDARAFLQTLAAAFPDRLYVEIQRHDLPEEKLIEADLVDLAYELNLPLVATNEPRILNASQNTAFEAMLCIKHGKTLTDPERPRLSPEHYFKTAEQMVALFSDLPEAIENTVHIAKRCAFKVPTGINYMPEWDEEGDVDQMLVDQAHKGLEDRLQNFVFTAETGEDEKAATRKHYTERLDYELGIIKRMGFSGYFLIVSDFCKWSKDNDIPVGPGRGSGAGSLVAWSLQITNVNPIPYGLLFERFLNPDRVSLPDFDIDFCQDRREEVIQYVRRKYGDAKVAQIITFGTLKARACIRDVGRVMQLPFGQVSRIAAFIPEGPKAIPIPQALSEDERLRDLYETDDDVKSLLDIAQQIEGAYRHCSTHAAGVIIAPKPINELCPLYRDPRAPLPATQFSMFDAEAAGLVKFDFLGLKTLTVIKTCLALMRRRGVEVDIDRVPMDDKASFDLLASGNTVGVFQVEGSGMQQLMRDAKPDRFEDLVALISLYRPGPMENIPSFIARKHGKEKIASIHASFDDYLKETYGIIVYQEQVMQCAQAFAGYSLGGADLLRRAMGKKKPEEMAKQREIFVSGAVERHGVAPEYASQVFDTIEKFAGYGFNKSHSLAYAVVSYHTLYLKTHYPLEFMAASMTLDRGSSDKVFKFKQELDRMGVKLLQPDINKSPLHFEVEGESIRFALSAVKGAGEEAMRAIVAEREANGPYKDVLDFISRQNPATMNRRQLEALVKAGAFDSLGHDRRQLVENADLLLGFMQSTHEEKNSNQIGLFGGGEKAELPRPTLRETIPYDPLEQLAHEQAAIGFYLSAHPLDTFKEELAALGQLDYMQDINDKALSGQTTARVAGIILAKREMRSKSGKRMAFLTVSDATGQHEVALFPEAYANYADYLEDKSAPLVFTLKIETNGETIRLSTESVSHLEGAGNMRQALRIDLPNLDAVDHIKAMLEEQQDGQAACELSLPVEGIGRVLLRLNRRIQIKRQFQLKIGSLPNVSCSVVTH